MAHKKKVNTVKSLYGDKERKRSRRLAVFFGILSVIIIFLTYYGQNVGSFSIRLDDDMADRQIYLSTDKSFSWKDSRLESDSLSKATVTSLLDVDQDLVKATDGATIGNSRSYVGFTFYMVNESKEMVDIEEALRITRVTEGLDNYSWVWFFENDEYDGSVYHKKDEIETTYPFDYPNLNEFQSDTVIFNKRFTMKPGEIKKFSMILWVDYNDPDITTKKVAGALRISLRFQIVKEHASQ